MKSTHYHTGVSGRARFVTVEESKGKQWTSDGYAVKTVDLKDAMQLIGQKVQLNGHIGRITDLPSNNSDKLPGKYIGEGKYLSRKDLSQYNDAVCVYWETGMNPSWVSFFKLKLL